MSDPSHGAHEHHITSAATLIATFLALVALTILTSVQAEFGEFGRAEIWITLGIATLKAALVAMIFMHLLHDKAFNGIILIATMLFVSLFMGFALMDTGQYAHEIDAHSTDVKQRIADTATP
ncbi:MAG: cytochrome C oxidase subunit IV family protein [Planctomycetales bacterium]|nr:cytochrome C oxidase subunit IV family protein [Planctomycetales bacterium]